MGTDKLAAELESIRERAANELEKWRLTPEPSGGIHMSAHDVPRLLKMADAVLCLADDWVSERDTTSALTEDRAWVHNLCGTPLREAVSDALLGSKEGSQ